MRPWFVLALTACSPSREEPKPAPRHEEPRHSIDLTVEQQGIAIRGVELVRAGKNLELGYRIEAAKDVVVNAEIMCRVHGYNLLYPTSPTGKVPGPRLTATFRPDPFDDVPQVCEVDFTHVAGGVSANATHLEQMFQAPVDSPIARACFRDNVLVDGACERGTFRSTKDDAMAQLRATADVEIEHGKLEIKEDAAVLTALFTKVEPMASGHYALQLSCADAGGPIIGEAGFAIVPLDRIGESVSVYGPVPILLDRKPQPLAACDLRIVSRAAQGPPNERLHAAYCATTQAIRAGRCTPN